MRTFSFWKYICFDVEGGGTGAGETKPDPIAALAAEVKTLTATVSELKTTQAGHIARVAGGLIDEKLKSIAPAPIVKDEKKVDEVKQTADERVTKLEAELKERDKRAEEAEKKSTIAQGISKLPLSDPGIADYLTSQIFPKMEKQTDGSYLVNTTRKLESTGETIPEKVSAEEILNRLTKGTWMLKTTVQGGLVTSGQQTNFSSPPTYAQLMNDPVLLRQWSEKKPDETKAIMDKGHKESLDKMRRR